MTRSFAITTMLLGAAAYAAASFLHGDARPAERPAHGALSVTVTRPGERTITERIGATGFLVPREEIAVMAAVSDVLVRSLEADVGDAVRKGETLAVLDAESLRLQVAQMEAEYAKARGDHDRVEAIKGSGAVSKSLVIEKKIARDVAMTRLEEARLAVRRAVVTAPEAGTVIERRAIVGGLASRGEALFRIAKDGAVEAELRVPEGQAGRVTPQRPVTLSVPGLESPLAGTVRLVSPRIDASDRSSAVRVSIAGPRPPMIGGFVHGEIALDAVTALAVPTAAVQRDAAGAFVWTVDDADTVVRRSIRPLAGEDGVTLVSGVTPDTRVVARAGSLVRSGDVVKTVEMR